MRKKWYLVRVLVSYENPKTKEFVHTLLVNCSPGEFLSEVKNRLKELCLDNIHDKFYFDITNIYIL